MAVRRLRILPGIVRCAPVAGSTGEARGLPAPPGQLFAAAGVEVTVVPLAESAR